MHAGVHMHTEVRVYSHMHAGVHMHTKVRMCHGAKAGEQDREQMKNLFID